MIKAIIFDGFGVLLTDALTAMVQEFRKHDPVGADQIVALVVLENRGVLSMQDFTEQAANILSISPDQLRDKVRDGEVRNKELFEYILELRKMYKTAILSNISSEGFSRRFLPEELAQYFDTAVSSGAIGYAKPDPEAYRITADRLGVLPEECIMIDDVASFCDGACSAGMQAILFQSNTQLKADLAKLLA